MSSGKRLTEYEKDQIDAFRSKEDGYLKIANALNRSVTAVANYVKGKTGQTTSKGRPKKLTMQQEVQIVNKASNSLKSLSKIKRELKLKVSKWTIWRDKFLFEPQLNRCFELASLFARFESDRKHLGTARSHHLRREQAVQVGCRAEASNFGCTKWTQPRNIPESH